MMNRRDFFKQSGSFALSAACAAACRRAASAGERPGAGPNRAPASGPLRVHPRNPRYFGDPDGNVIYVTGAHTWSNLIDMGPSDPPPAFDFQKALRFAERYNHNFMRMWAWELVSWDTRGNGSRLRKKKTHTTAPHPWLRTGPGKAADGKPKFDLTKFNPDYFQRLRTRVQAAGQRGVYVSVMLFEGWAVQFCPNGFTQHPFYRDNNINRIDGDADGDGKGLEIHELKDAAITKIQETYVKKVVDTVNNLDNVLYEISNENHPPSTPWQYHMIDLVHDYEKGKPKQHPVGMTFQYRGGANKTLFDSPADWISPNGEGGYRDNPPAASGKKVILADTDHLWGIGGNQAWVWKSFLRGLNPIFMDPYDGVVLGQRFNPQWDPIRRSLGYTLQWAQRMNLAKATPRGGLASTRYCLADPGAEYLVYSPQGGEASVDLSAAAGRVSVEWFDPANGKSRKAAPASGGATGRFSSPFGQHDAVLYLRAT